ncbi:uncharacterized protein LOC114412337 [Glycine soja]|uniref:uncharacterized protein n=1 Tax=Glycine max TaxID=3847 RepID=UPI0003DE9E0D|nr:uncharacterized protein LOC102670027 [Glycine max]XP_028232015.1 uncharacterized protein LOC114412337 [Glycine soja]|eukprot:XP_006574045.1 uncharacterized protein LOC102670027 [Glycine max]
MSNHKSTEPALKNLEIQVGQLAKQLAEKSSNSFGANIEKNPKEECNAVMTRNKKRLVVEDEDRVALEKQIVVKDGTEKKKEEENIIVEGNCSAIIEIILPPKHKDPGSVTIPCSIDEVTMGKALIDLRASINLIPLSMCRRLGELEIMPTRMTLQLADRSITRPYEVIEDVLIRVKHMVFPADFVVMDVEEDHEVPVILGRPFMSTASCIIDMRRKTLEMGFEDQKINFDLFEENKPVPEHNVCLQVMEVEEEVLKLLQSQLMLTLSASKYPSGTDSIAAEPTGGSSSRIHPISRAVQDASSETTIPEPFTLHHEEGEEQVRPETAATPERSLEGTSEPPTPVADLSSPQPAAEPSTPKLEILEDPTTLVLALNTSPPATPVLHLTGEEDAQTQDTQDLSLEF